MRITLRVESWHFIGKLQKSTPIVGEVDSKFNKSPLPHFQDKRDNICFLVDTEAEISVVKPMQQEKQNKT